LKAGAEISKRVDRRVFLFGIERLYISKHITTSYLHRFTLFALSRPKTLPFSPIGLFEMARPPAATAAINFPISDPNSFSPTTLGDDEHEWHPLLPRLPINKIPSSALLAVDMDVQSSTAHSLRPPSFTRLVQIRLPVGNRLWNH
jgi:hypothetical protein